MANLQPPFIDLNGSKWSQSSIDTYNRFNEQVEKREKLNNPSEQSKQELEFYRDQRHKTFIQLAEIEKQKRETKHIVFSVKKYGVRFRTSDGRNGENPCYGSDPETIKQAIINNMFRPGENFTQETI
jgi:hypothetical protein